MSYRTRMIGGLLEVGPSSNGVTHVSCRFVNGLVGANKQPANSPTSSGTLVHG